MELTALKAMLEKDLFCKYSSILSGIKNMTQEHKQIIKTIDRYYDQYPEQTYISVDNLMDYFWLINPASNKETLGRIFDALSTCEITNYDLMGDILNHFVELHVMSEIHMVSGRVLAGEKATAIEDVDKLIQQFKENVKITLKDEALWFDESLEAILASEKQGELPWPNTIPFLSRSLGDLRTGTLGHIFARPDGGKTSFALNLIAFWARALNHNHKEGSLLYLNNEEHPRVVKKRLIQAMLNMEIRDLAKDPVQAERRFNELGGDRIRIMGDVNHVKQIEQFVARINPKAVIIDQGPKVWIPGGRDMAGPERLQRLYNKYRQIAIAYDTIFVSLGQADGASENKRILSLNNMDASKVGIPGELDWCLGIGRITEDESLANTRWINIAKNKLSGHPGHVEVQFNPEKCRYEEVK
jgi:hypothetical protein